MATARNALAIIGRRLAVDTSRLAFAGRVLATDMGKVARAILLLAACPADGMVERSVRDFSTHGIERV
uniref:Uncharacterized protein n=1 Tax=Candidatus Kentrum sp. SD TaxID=2126332 RepID=A0A451BLM9_9GAMM|nr:MAG: hypothetical protein BECKSD772D_GA0070982_10403 [Candidatus Kentron sp. SD]